MKPKGPRGGWSLPAACLLLAALLLAPAAQAQSPVYTQITVNILNNTQSAITIQEAMIQQGQWVQGQQPIAGTQYPANSTMGPFASMTQLYGEANAVDMRLNVGIISWGMNWGNPPQMLVQLSGAGLQSQISGPLPDPDSQHVVYNITISKQ